MMTTTDYLNQHTGQLKEKDRFEIKFLFPLIDTAHSIARIFVFFSKLNESETILLFSLSLLPFFLLVIFLLVNIHFYLSYQPIRITPGG
jgi:hypothetical protein